MAKRLLLGGAAVTFYVTAAVTAYRIQKIRNKEEPHPEIASPAYQKTVCPKANKVFDELSTSYDNKIDTDEWLLGITSKRRKLLKHAYGDVLEVSSGTGRNLPFYSLNETIKALTLSDCNIPMLKASQLTYLQKFKNTLPHTSFVVQDSENLLYEDETFDTVVDTFGLCSCEDPVKAVQEMARVSKSGGILLLLEHGRCTYSWLNEILDKGVLDHVTNWGCFWNRDIESVIKEAGLNILEMKRHHLGIMYYIVAQKN